MTAQTPAIIPQSPSGTLSVFGSEGGFVAAQRMAAALSNSNMVPKEYQGNIANCLIALELSARLNASVFMVMQHLNIIHGRPSFSAQFMIAAINASGRFDPLRYEEVGKPGTDEYGFRAYATDKLSGEVLVGDAVTWGTVKAEGWLSRQGSKWKSIPGQMFRYRAAAFWLRVYAPETLMGLPPSDEVEDFVSDEPRSRQPAQPAALTAPVDTVRAPAGMDALAAALGGDEEPAA